MEELDKLRGSFEGEAPAQSLESFRGTLKADGEVFNLVDSKQLLYRGAKLMNTERVWGLVAYAGQCSKIMLNSQLSSSKISVVEKKVNLMLIVLFICQIILCVVMASLGYTEDSRLQKSHSFYLDYGDVVDYSNAKKFVLTFCLFFIDFSSIIPVSLLVTVDMVKLAQSYFIDFDKLLYSPSKNRGSLAKNTTLN